MKAILGMLLLCSAAIAQAAGDEERGLTISKAAPAVVASGEQRIALVIGNSHYKESPLINPVNDARAMARALAAADFKVTSRENAGHKAMLAALRDFGDALKNGGVGLFYYAGHAVQVKGRNYLIPIDAQIEREDEVAYSGVDANLILDKMEAAGNRLNIVILDACRNNPFARSARSAGGGLAQMDAPVGTLIAFSTSPGSVASDGKGKNGLYTQHLLDAMKVPGTKIEDVFKQVRTKVRQDTKGQQIPWESTSLEGDFVFVALAPKPTIAAARTLASVPPAAIDQISAPSLKVGDSWTYQTVDLFSGSLKRRYTLTLKTITTDEWQFGASTFDKSWNLLREVRDGKVVAKWSPKRPNFEFPLQPGKTWNGRGVLEREDLRSEHSVDFKVVRQERVFVPAGVFDTFRVEGTGNYKSVKKDGQSGEGRVTHRYWYSPKAARFVVYEYEETNWKGVLSRKERSELLSYRHENSPAPR
jgi:hypothetical protein